jgi:hypothetical protein
MVPSTGTLHLGHLVLGLSHQLEAGHGSEFGHDDTRFGNFRA